MNKQIFYFSGTHWDREWYENYQAFRLRLVNAIDDMITHLEENPDFKVFHFDGQIIVFEDYLEIRPENEMRLRALIKSGRILIGPWYCMPDEFLVSGEALIHNLLAGSRLSRQLGADSWKVGYVCDVFGHTAQMPQIFTNFKMKGAVIGRGTNEHTTPAFFKWASPDDSSILTYKIPDNFGYGAYALTTLGQLARGEETDPESEKFICETNQYLEREWNRTPLPYCVIMDGMDHEPLHPKTVQYINKIRDMHPDTIVRHENLEHLFTELKQYDTQLMTRKGELYESGKGFYGGFIHVLTHVLSSHPSAKRRNDYCQALLEKWLEPMYIYYMLHDLSYPQSYLTTAWKWLLQNHPHDSICGCSADRVHNDMAFRFSQVESITEAIQTDAERKLADGYRRISKTNNKLCIVNPTLYERTVTVTCRLPFEPDYPKYKEPFGYQDIAAFRLYDEHNNEIPYAIKNIETSATVLPQGEQTLPADIYAVVFRAHLNAFGITTLNIEESDFPVRFFGTLGAQGILDNQLLRINVNEDGTINMYDYKTDKTYRSLIGLLDDAEIGDGWHSVRPIGCESICRSTLVSVTETVKSPVYSELEIIRVLTLPEETDRKKSGISRSTSHVSFTVKQTVGLTCGERKVNIKVSYENNVKDHRLRMVFPIDNACDSYEANQAFTFVKRASGRNAETADWKEADQLEKPMHGILLAREENSTGIAFVGKYGFYECSMEDCVQKALYVTCHRGFGKVYYEDHLTDAQELGTHTMNFILMPLDSEISNTQLQVEQDLLQTGFRTFAATHAVSNYPFKLEGNIAVSCIKPAENCINDMIIRFYNPSDQDESYKLHMDKNHNIQYCCMDESPLDNNDLPQNTNVLTGIINKQQIMTVRIIELK